MMQGLIRRHFDRAWATLEPTFRRALLRARNKPTDDINTILEDLRASISAELQKVGRR